METGATVMLKGTRRVGKVVNVIRNKRGVALVDVKLVKNATPIACRPSQLKVISLTERDRIRLSYVIEELEQDIKRVQLICDDQIRASERLAHKLRDERPEFVQLLTDSRESVLDEKTKLEKEYRRLKKKTDHIRRDIYFWYEALRETRRGNGELLEEYDAKISELKARSSKTKKKKSSSITRLQCRIVKIRRKLEDE